MTAPKDPHDPKANDPWANFPGGNPFGPGGPLSGGSGDPFRDMESWFRGMGIDPNEFRRLAEEMQRNLQDAFKGLGTDPSKSFVSGFNVRIGPDGKPQFSSFGNKPTVRPGTPKGIPQVVSDEREPLTDVIEDEATIAITMELPGVQRDDINLNMTESELEIAVDTERRKYHKRVKLPAPVDAATTKATYTNGILDVTVRKTAPGKRGVRIAVE